MKILPATLNCFACGTQNAGGLQLKMSWDGLKVMTEFYPRPEHSGFAHAVHGGILATALDEAMAWAVIASAKKPAYSAEFTVRFHLPARAGQAYRLEGEVTLNRKDRYFETHGVVLDADGRKCASATGKYFALPPEEAALALRDFPPNSGAEELLGLGKPGE